MNSFLANVRYTTAPVPSDLIPSCPQPREQILWVGCSDSQVIETDVLNFPRHEMFVHRNLGNKLSNGDMSSRSAIEFCVQDIQVRHVIICGHYGCGLINTNADVGSLKGWLDDLSELRESNEAFFEQGTELKTRDRRLVELNVLAQIYWLLRQPSVTKAISERGMQVHGFVYDTIEKSCVRLEITSPINSSSSDSR